MKSEKSYADLVNQPKTILFPEDQMLNMPAQINTWDTKRGATHWIINLTA